MGRDRLGTVGPARWRHLVARTACSCRPSESRHGSGFQERAMRRDRWRECLPWLRVAEGLPGNSAVNELTEISGTLEPVRNLC